MPLNTAAPRTNGCRSVVIMGVSGCGKSTFGSALAEALGWRFLEGDAFHPAENVARMAAGTPLTDADRSGWLLILGAALSEARTTTPGVVLACSALKRAYRDTLRAAAPGLRFIHLHGDAGELARRVAARAHPYMPASLLDSQLETLEVPLADEDALTLDLGAPLSGLLAHAQAWLVSEIEALDLENEALSPRSAA